MTDDQDTYTFSHRVEGLKSSAIRELLRVINRPGVISFAGGLPGAAHRDTIDRERQALRQIIVPARNSHRVARLRADQGRLQSLLSIGAWQVIGMNLANIAPISGIPLGVVYMACMLCSVGMGILLLGSIYRLLTGQMTEQEMCPDFDDAL